MLPDYGAGGLLRLVQTVHVAAGIRDGPIDTDDELHRQLSEARSIVFLLVDGMGQHQVLKHVPDGVLRKHMRGPLSAVFPSTTASSITSWMTATAPSEHAMTGWHIRLAGSGRVVAPLPFRERGSGRALESIGVRLDEVFKTPSAFARINVPVAILQPRSLIETTYTRFHAARAKVHGYDGFSDMLARASRILAQDRPALLYAYWPEFDSIAHRHGSDSAAAARELGRIDRELESFLARAAALGAVVIVTADHGFIDVPRERCLWLNDHPDLRAMLYAPLCGEPRTVYCYVCRSRESEFEDYIDRHLGVACERHRSEELVEQGWFGADASADLYSRVGSYVLMLRDDYMLRDCIAGEQVHEMIGIHGGASQREMQVPLIVVGPDTVS